MKNGDPKTESEKTLTKREKKESLGPSKTELWIESGFKIYKIRGIEHRVLLGTILATCLGANVSTMLFGVFVFVAVRCQNK